MQVSWKNIYTFVRMMKVLCKAFVRPLWDSVGCFDLQVKPGPPNESGSSIGIEKRFTVTDPR